MRSRLLMGPTGPGGKALPGNPYVSRDVSRRQRVCGTAQGAPMEPQHSLPGYGRGVSYQTVGRRISKTLCVTENTSFICTPRGAGSGDVRNDAPSDTREGHEPSSLLSLLSPRNEPWGQSVRNQRDTTVASWSLCKRFVLAPFIVRSTVAD